KRRHPEVEERDVGIPVARAFAEQLGEGERADQPLELSAQPRETGHDLVAPEHEEIRFRAAGEGDVREAQEVHRPAEVPVRALDALRDHRDPPLAAREEPRDLAGLAVVEPAKHESLRLDERALAHGTGARRAIEGPVTPPPPPAP